MINLSITASTAAELTAQMQALGYVPSGPGTVVINPEGVSFPEERSIKPGVQLLADTPAEDTPLADLLEVLAKKDAPEEKTEDEPVIDKAALREAARKLAKAKGKTGVQQVLELYGVASVGDIKEEDYAAAHHDFLDAM